MRDEKTQAEKFAALTREVEADPDQKARDERLKKVVKHERAPEKPE